MSHPIAKNNTQLTVWLAYVSYPVTTAAYLERGLRRICNCVTVGPCLPENYIELWMLQNLKLPVKPHNIPTSFTPDIDLLYIGTPEELRPDLFLFVESVGGFIPHGLTKVSCPKACYLIDNHVSLSAHLELAKQYDYVFIAQLAYLEQFKAVNTHTYWLPLGCDPEVHFAYPVEKKYDVAFAGGVLEGTRRWNILNLLSKQCNFAYDRVFWDEMAVLFSSAKMILNNAFKDDMNMRCFEALSVGSLMLADMAHGSGQDELFISGEEYALYTDDTILDTVYYYLEHAERREQIAQNGRKIVHAAHTYVHRAEDLLAVIMNGKQNTWTPRELRVRSESVVKAGVITTDGLQNIRISSGYRLPAHIRGVGYYPHDSYPIFQYFNELAEDFAVTLGAELIPTDFRQPFAYYGENEYNLVFVTMVSQLRPYQGNRQLVAIVNDVWPHDFDEFETLVRDLPLVYVTCEEISHRLQQRGLHQVHFLPFSVSERHLCQKVPDKNIDIIQYGRVNPVLHSYMSQLLEECPWLHYITTDVDMQTKTVWFKSNQLGRVGRSDNRSDFIHMLSRCRASLVSSPGYDGERAFDGCSTVAIRYFESASQFCHMFGRHPDNGEFKQLGINEVCTRIEEYDGFKSSVLDCLEQTFSKEKEDVYRRFLFQHTTRNRALSLLHDLDCLNGLRR